MSDKLREICEFKRREVEARKGRYPQAELERSLGDLPCRGFAQALLEKASTGAMALIAEIKKASPSKGLIRADFDPRLLAEAYTEGGASCLSVLTESHYFQGSDEALQMAREATTLPCLRKDFTIDAYQILEARALGADAILLIVAALSGPELRSFASLAHEIGLDVLIEVHSGEELERALKVEIGMIGINNRNLKSLTVRTDATLELAPLVPRERLVVAESGIQDHDDLRRMHDAGARAFLVGESLMREADVSAATRLLLGLKADA